jgi:protein gp37
MNATGIPYLDFGWNPCGFGCSRGCPTCWARTQAAGPYIRRNCEACGRFEVHFHPERLDQPGKRKKPAVIGVNFTGELFDPQRRPVEIMRVLDAAHSAPQHTYVFLTQRPDIARGICAERMEFYGWDVLPDNWVMGATATDCLQFEQNVNALSAIPARRWISLEPLSECIPWSAYAIDGVVIGCNNRPGEPWDMDWARQARDAAQAAGAKVYIKQLWMWRCGICGAGLQESPGGPCCACGQRSDHRWKRTLVKDPHGFPEDLRIRDLPWDLTTKEA